MPQTSVYDPSKITLYHLAVSQSDRIVWLLEELDLSYNLEWFDRGEDMLAPPEYRALHPVGTAPIIRDGDTVLGESAAICEYISQKRGGGALSVAVADPNYGQYLYWMEFSGNVQSTFFARIAAGEKAGSSNGLAMMLRRETAYYQHLNQRLSESPFLAGNTLSCADIMVLFNLTVLPQFGGPGIEGLPHVQAYVERLTARPAYQRAMAIAGPEATSANISLTQDGR